MNTKTITIADDFSPYPAGRFREDGDASGEEFREDHLVPALADKNFERVEVIFDGVAGLGSSFLEESFGGLVRKHDLEEDDLRKRLHLETSEADLKDFVALAWRYVEAASGTR